MHRSRNRVNDPRSRRRVPQGATTTNTRRIARRSNAAGVLDRARSIDVISRAVHYYRRAYACSGWLLPTRHWRCWVAAAGEEDTARRAQQAAMAKSRIPRNACPLSSSMSLLFSPCITTTWILKVFFRPDERCRSTILADFFAGLVYVGPANRHVGQL